MSVFGAWSITQMLVLDAIIGNTDRHQDNWQIVDYTTGSKRLLSPAFDNGTSLGYNIRAEHLASWLGGDWQNKQSKQVKNGRHHMKWQIDDAKQANHFELLEKMVEQFPECRDIISKVLQQDISHTIEEIRQLTTFIISDERYKLTNERAGFIVKMIEYRYNHARKLFGL